jgi:hypothetical protein
MRKGGSHDITQRIGDLEFWYLFITTICHLISFVE